MSSLETSDLTRLCAGSKYFVSELGFNHCFRDVADIISRAIPETFATSETIESEEFGSLPVKKAKGEGGRSDLATRLGNNYYNDYNVRGKKSVKSLANVCQKPALIKIKKTQLQKVKINNIIRANIELCEY
jgi:hypothetical protein